MAEKGVDVKYYNVAVQVQVQMAIGKPAHAHKAFTDGTIVPKNVYVSCKRKYQIPCK